MANVYENSSLKSLKRMKKSLEDAIIKTSYNNPGDDCSFMFAELKLVIKAMEAKN